MISMTDGTPTTPHTTVSFHFQVEGSRTLPPGDSSPCEAGDVLSLLTIREMMRLFGVSVKQYDNSLKEIPGFVAVKSQILAGIDWLSQMIGAELESR